MKSVRAIFNLTAFFLVFSVSGQYALFTLKNGEQEIQKIIGSTNNSLYVEGEIISLADIKLLEFRLGEDVPKKIVELLKENSVEISFSGTFEASEKVRKTKGIHYAGNFYVYNDDIYFEKIYSLPENSDNEINERLRKHFKESYFNSDSTFLNFRGYRFNAVIQVKDEKYRVLLTDFTYDNVVTQSKYNWFGYFGQSQSSFKRRTTTLENALSKRSGGFKQGDRIKSSLEAYSNALEEHFDIEHHENLKSADW